MGTGESQGTFIITTNALVCISFFFFVVFSMSWKRRSFGTILIHCEIVFRYPRAILLEALVSYVSTVAISWNLNREIGVFLLGFACCVLTIFHFSHGSMGFLQMLLLNIGTRRWLVLVFLEGVVVLLKRFLL